VFAVFTVDGAVVGETLVAAEDWPLGSPPPAVAARASRRRLRAQLERALRGKPAADADVPSVTLVISSTGSESLTACLDSVAALEHPPARTILLAPEGHGAHVSDACAGRDLRLESYDGPLAEARNGVLAEARTPLVAFASDQCVIDRHWFSRIGVPFRDRLVHAVTGYELPSRLETRAECLHRLRSSGPPGREPALVCLRASTIDEVGPFDTRLGPGTRRGGSDIDELLSRAVRLGYRVTMDPERTIRRAHPGTMVRLRRVRAAELRSAGFRRGARDLLGEIRRQLTRDPLRAPLSLAAAEALAVLRAAFAVRPRLLRGQARPSAVHEPPPIRVGRAEHPDLSVAIASHNRRDSLRSVLLRLADQAYPSDRYEVAVVLDGSTDGSAEMVRSLDVPYELRAVEQEQRGLAASRNRGAQEARHPLVLFLDDDLMPVRGFLAAHGSAHRDAAGGVVLGHSPPAQLGHSWWAQQVRAWWEDRYRRMREPDHRWSFVDFADGNLSMTRSALEASGGWDDGFPRRQDWELAVRLLDAGIEFSFCEEATAWHHFELSLRAAIANQRAVGASDAAFARRHMRWSAHLELAEIATVYTQPTRRGRLVRAAYRRPSLVRAFADRSVALLATLEALGARRAWSRALGRAMTAQYVVGVRTAVPSLAGLGALAGEMAQQPAERVTVSLERPGPAKLPERPGPLQVCMEDGHGPAICVPGTPPMQQWDWDALIERIIENGGERLPVALTR